MKRIHPRLIVVGADLELDRSQRAWADHEAALTGADVVVLPERSAGVVQAGLREDVIVIGTGEGGVVRHLIRDDAPHPVLSAAKSVVVVVPSRWQVPSSARQAHVAVGYAADAAGRAALDWAIHRAERTDAVLDVLQAVVPLPGEHAIHRQDDPLKHAREVLGEDRVHVRYVDATIAGAADAIAERARHAEVLVLGNRHANLLAALTGWSVAEKVASSPPCPVVLVPAQEVQS